MVVLLAQRQRLWLVAPLGDLATFAIFPLLGSANHDNDVESASFVRTFVPFAIVWPVAGLLASAFAASTVRSARRTLLIVPPAWLAAGIAGIALRVNLFDRDFAWSFSIVAIGVTGAMLLAWRLVLAAIVRHR